MRLRSGSSEPSVSSLKTPYPGQHPAIIEQATWDAVQALLKENYHQHDGRISAQESSLLTRLVFDAQGRRFQARHATHR